MRALVLIVNRLIWFVPTLLGLLIITFTISHIIPADPIAFIAGDNATAEQIAALKAKFGVDKPVMVQLWNYILGVFQGDFGVSLYTQRPIADDLVGRLPATLELAFVAIILSAIIGIPLAWVMIFVVGLWVIYRMVRGVLRLADGRDIELY